jgi:nucleoid-associated protein YgaU
MIDRRTGPTVVLLLAVVVAGCLPEAVGPGRSGGGRPAATPPPTPAPSGPSPSPSFVRPTPTPMPSFTSYVVKAGDSLNTIAHRFKTTARSIAFWNRATYPSLDPDSGRYSPNSIRVGWTLLLIPGVVYDENAGPEPTDVPVP